MAIWLPTPIRSNAPAAGCRPCTSQQTTRCPEPITIRVGCGNCFNATLLAYRFLGALTCWQPSDGHCNPNLCCPWITLDPWPAFRSGLWVSSTVIPVYTECPSGGPQSTTLQVVMSPALLSKPITTGAAPGCGVTQVGLITVFNDGTFTLA